MAVTREELGRFQEKLGTTAILAAAIAKVYLASPDPAKLYNAQPGSFLRKYPSLSSTTWTDSGIYGAALFVYDTANYTLGLQVWSLRRNKCVFNYELYNDFQYVKLTSDLHNFEIDDCVMGFAFSNATEAAKFYEKVSDTLRKVQAANAVVMSPARRSPAKTVPPTPAQPAKSKLKRGLFKQKSKNKDLLPALPDRGKSGSSGGALNKKKKKNPIIKRQQQGLSINPDGSLDTSALPAEWKRTFKEAGLTKKDLRDPRMASVVLETLQKQEMVWTYKDQEQYKNLPEVEVEKLAEANKDQYKNYLNKYDEYEYKKEQFNNYEKQQEGLSKWEQLFKELPKLPEEAPQPPEREFIPSGTIPPTVPPRVAARDRSTDNMLYDNLVKHNERMLNEERPSKAKKTLKKASNNVFDRLQSPQLANPDMRQLYDSNMPPPTPVRRMRQNSEPRDAILSSSKKKAGQTNSAVARFSKKRGTANMQRLGAPMQPRKTSKENVLGSMLPSFRKKSSFDIPPAPIPEDLPPPPAPPEDEPALPVLLPPAPSDDPPRPTDSGLKMKDIPPPMIGPGALLLDIKNKNAQLNHISATYNATLRRLKRKIDAGPQGQATLVKKLRDAIVDRREMLQHDDSDGEEGNSDWSVE